MSLRFICAIASTIFHCIHLARSEHIVFLHGCSGFSHRVPHWPLALALLEKGHKVTFLGTYSGGRDMSHPNITEVVSKSAREFMELILSYFDINQRIAGFTAPSLLVFDLAISYTNLKFYQSDEFQLWFKRREKVDLVISDAFQEYAYPLVKKLESKFIIFSTIPFMAKTFESFGIPAESSSIPDWNTVFKPPLSFWGRVVGAILPLAWRVTQLAYYDFWGKYMLSEYLDLEQREVPDLYEMEEKVSLVMVNGGHLEDFPRSYPPFVVKVPGMHLGDMEDKKLPVEVENFIGDVDCVGKSCSDRVVYISFGTVAKASTLPLDVLDMFFHSMEAFPETKFIWKWTGEKPKKYPSNLLIITNWVHQQKLLSNPKVKGFITQTGRHSIQEAFYHGVPTIAIPILGDQDYNAMRYELLGASVNLEISTLTQKQLFDALDKILSNASFINHAKKMSELSKDVPERSVDKALWWTEYVLRHSQDELNLLKPLAQKQWWFQRRELDVWAFIVVCLVGLSLLWYKLVRMAITKIVLRFGGKEKLSNATRNPTSTNVTGKKAKVQ